MIESNIMAYVNNLFTFSQVGLLCLISIQYRLLFADFFTWFLIGDINLHLSLMFVRKPELQERKLDELCDYITNMISPCMWLMVDSDVTLC